MLLKPLRLQNSWCFWYNFYIGPGKTVEEYDKALSRLCTFDTAQEFWSYYNHLPAVSDLPPRASYHLMKSGVKPLWEDKANEKGGNWSIKVRSCDTQGVWLDVLLAVIGEQFQCTKNDDLCGVTISVRNDGFNIVEIWNYRVNESEHDLLQQFYKIVHNGDFSTCPPPSYRVHQELSGFKNHAGF
eukprot:CAMPEP_0177668554 /NCGR_PEP_ID=MMETSP0447-20121125/22847_1 /TAXON_ID=0 /ORGANISM="Stygamoeba regulata, Strain BSH-02190019" /LENGTH=184 /DNA_ID=CAMNT_0019175117 /DNA_START=306 /DNA_END=860 /DNA_ORIENTATION=+